MARLQNPAATESEMADEVELLNYECAHVTSVKAVLDGTAYPIGGITSVRMVKQTQSLFVPLVMGLNGTTFLYCAGLVALDPRSDGVPSLWGFLFGLGGLGMLAIGGAVLSRGADFVVLIAGAGREVSALRTTNRVMATCVRDALDAAITNRG